MVELIALLVIAGIGIKMWDVAEELYAEYLDSKRKK